MSPIGQLAQQVGVRTSAIRYYETQGLVMARGRTSKGYRIYDESHVSILRFIRRAQELSISLAEIKQLLSLHGRGEQPCKQVRALARQHVHEIDAKIEQLQGLRGQLNDLLRLRPRRRKLGEVCPMIERGASQPSANKH